ncbi:hypothetical protein EDD85DRAFT_960757 [Armillaria nabsnona]|nr:hypothetical protein EDD85DRAFT_960757 [Armillaria nabsnona]
MTFRFSASFEKEMKEVGRYLSSISHVSALYIDFRSLSFAPLPGVKQCQSDVLLSFKEFCETLSKLKCRTLTTSAYASSLKLLEDTTFKPLPLTTLRTITLYAQPKHFMDWLVYSMNHSNVRSLTLMFNGADILPCLTLPRLTNLLCRGPNTSLVAVRTFLSRHPTLQSLHLLGGTSPANMNLLQDGVGPFPCMKSISASADTLAILLEFPQAFPILQDVCMQGPITANDTNIRLVRDMFMLISRIPTITAIKFPLTNLTSKGWGSFDYRAVNATRFTSAEEFSIRAESLLTSITKLTASAAEGHNYGVRFFQAVARFPSVRELHVNDVRLRTASAQVKFIMRLQPCCPSLKRVFINLVEHHLDEFA